MNFANYIEMIMFDKGICQTILKCDYQNAEKALSEIYIIKQEAEGKNVVLNRIKQ